MADARTIDRLVAEGMRDAGRTFLLEGPGAGAARASEVMKALLGGLGARVWMKASKRREPGAVSPLEEFLAEVVTREGYLEKWTRQGREAEPIVIDLRGRKGEPAAELLRGGAERVLVLPLFGTFKMLGAFGVTLGPGSAPSGKQVSAARLMAELTGIGLDVMEKGLAARETEERLRRFLRQLPDPALLLDENGVIRDVSETIVEMAGVRPEALVGRSISSLVMEEDRGAVEEAVRLALARGDFRGTFGVRGRRRGERREMELNIRRFSDRRVMASARDVTRRVRREHSLRVMLEHTARLMSSTSEEELWERLADAVRALLPRATDVWVYRGTDRGVKVVWSSRPDAPRWEFTVRGWGADVTGLLSQEDARDQFLRHYGRNRTLARQQLQAILSGRGIPLLLDRPAEQLSVFLPERELNAVLEFWGDEPPGQLIHCPVIADGRLELLVVVDAPAGERPFEPEDAAFPWQLTNLAHQALGRIEAFAVARRQLTELQAFREAVRQVVEARGALELMEMLARRAVWAVEADRGSLWLAEPGGWRCRWTGGEGAPDRGRLVHAPPLPEGEQGGARPLYLEDASKDEAWAQLAGEGASSVAAVPLAAMGREVGILVLANTAPRSFDASVREMAEFFADELALVVAQERLVRSAAEARALLAGVLDAVDQGLVMAAGDGRILRASRRALSLLGVTVSPPAGQSVLDLFPPSQRGGVAQGLARAIDGSAGHEVGLTTERGVLSARFHPLSGGGCLIVLSPRWEAGVSGPAVPATAAPSDVSTARRGTAEVLWRRAEQVTSRMNDLLTAVAGRLELGPRPEGDPLRNLVEEACETAGELRKLLERGYPDSRT